MFNRNIRLTDQRKRGSSTFVVFYSVPDYPNRVGWDLNTCTRTAAQQVKDAIAAIPESEYNYKTALDAASNADH